MLVCLPDLKPCSVVGQTVLYILLSPFQCSVNTRHIWLFRTQKSLQLALSGASNISQLTCQEHGSSAIQTKLSNVRKNCLLTPAASQTSCVIYHTILLFKYNFIRWDSFQPSKADSTSVSLSKYCREGSLVVNNHTEEKCSPVNRINLTNNCSLQAVTLVISPSSLFQHILTW